MRYVYLVFLHHILKENHRDLFNPIYQIEVYPSNFSLQQYYLDILYYKTKRLYLQILVIYVFIKFLYFSTFCLHLVKDL